MWRKFTEPGHNFCRNNWWINLLYLNNYLKINEPCLQQSWFLAVDFHFTILAVIFFLIIIKYPKTTTYIFSSAFIYSVIIVAFVIYTKNLEVGIPLWPEFMKHITIETEEYFYLHIATHTSIGNFSVGLAIGYIYYRLEKANIDLKTSRLMKIGWLLYIPIILTLFWSRIIYVYYDFESPSLFTAIHGTVIKHLFGIMTGLFLLGFKFNLGGKFMINS